MDYDLPIENPEKLFEALLESRHVMERVSYNHAYSTTGSTCSQFVAMTIFLEGKSGIVSYKQTQMPLVPVPTMTDRLFMDTAQISRDLYRIASRLAIKQTATFRKPNVTKRIMRPSALPRLQFACSLT